MNNQLFAWSNRVPNSMPSRGKNHEQQAANKPNSDRNNAQNLLSFVLRRWIKAAQDVLVSHSHSNEHQHRQNCMDSVDESDPVLAQIRQLITIRGAFIILNIIKQKQPFEGGKAVVHLSV